VKNASNSTFYYVELNRHVITFQISTHGSENISEISVISFLFRFVITEEVEIVLLLFHPQRESSVAADIRNSVFSYSYRISAKILIFLLYSIL
jgi:hypothetical protein